MLPKEQKEAFEEFLSSARENELLEPKTRAIAGLAASMALGCYP